MGYQKEIAQQIADKKGDYLLVVKEIQRLADETLENNHAGCSTNLLEEKGHGRRRCGFVM
jgi:hypothetical protein